MNNKPLIFAFLTLSFLISSCSKTKYRGVKQYTSNFVSYYNTYFNIQHRYKVGYREATQYKSENTSDIISVFEYENDPQYFKDIAVFKETMPKLRKLQAMRPNNKWMDDAYLVEGKIRYLKGESDSAVLILQNLVDNYPKGYIVGHLPGGKLKGYEEKLRAAQGKNKPIKQSFFKYKFARNEGQIWLAKALIKLGQPDKAQTIITTAENDLGFPLEYRKDLAKAQIMLNIYQKNLPKAKENLLKLIDEFKLTKKEKGRINFILAQLYEKENSLSAAKNHYDLALKGKLSDDLEFEAQLRSLSMSGESSSDEGLSRLKKMLNKGKYSSNLDKIYMAIGNIYIAKKADSTAMENYSKAIENSKNPNLKFVIFEKIGSIYYDKPDYLNAARYYDSAMTVMPAEYAGKKEFVKKAAALSKLLSHYNIYIQNDSMLELAKLGRNEAKSRIEKLLKKEYLEYKKKEFETKNLEAQILKPDATNPEPAGKSWYYTNTETMNKGRIIFQKKWGKISLQDNWKKGDGSSQNIVSSSANNSLDIPKLDFNDENSIDLVAEIQSNNLPYTPEAKKPIIVSTQKAIVELAKIYNYEIKDFKKAIEMYEILFSKYNSEIPNEDEVLYSLYRLYLEVENIAKAEEIKAKLIQKYPNSKYSLYATNPNAKSEDEKSEQLVSRLYKDAYKEYRIANYTTALGKCEDIEDQYPNHSLLGKVKLLKAFIYSYTNQSELYQQTLKEIVSKYTGSEEAKTAQEFLDIIAGKWVSPSKKTDLPTSNPKDSKVSRSLDNMMKSTDLPVDMAPSEKNLKNE